MSRDCDELLEELGDLLHGELDATRAAALRHHLDDCPPCLQSADFQARLKSLIAARCCEDVPEAFRLRILGFIESEARS